MTKPARPERWIFMIDENANADATKAFGKKLETLGASDGVKTVDSFPGTLLVQCNEAFAKRAKEEFKNELASVHRETVFERPRTGPHIRPRRP